MSTLVTTVFLVVMAAAMVTDATHERLPNRLTLLGISAGLLLRVPLGPTEVLLGLAGLLVAFLVGMPLFALGGLGGGDVKLLGAVGAFLGPTGLLWSLLLAGALGLALALAVTTARGVVLPALLQSRSLLLHAVTLGHRGERPRLEAEGAITVPYGLAIAAGAIVAWFLPFTEVMG